MKRRSTAARWSRDSRRLQRFLRAEFDPPPASCYHADMVPRVLALTDRWRASPRDYRQVERCTACPAFRLELPSRLHVVQTLLQRHPELWASLRHRVGTLPTDAALQRRLRAKDYSWFHAHSAGLLRAVADAAAVRQIEAISPDLHWCCNLWRRYPNLYDYFVPLDVQLYAERVVSCTQSRRWSWEGRTFALNVLAPHISIRPEILEQVAYRISLTAALGLHRCRAVELLWFPSNRKKLVGAKSAGPEPHCWTPLHINTGATYRNTCDRVTIWRSEECYKTVTHEMIHGFAWAFEGFPGIDDLVRQHFAVAPGTEIAFYESYVETWATMVNVYAIAAQQQNGSRDGHAAAKRRIRGMLGVERAFVVFQVAKLLHHSGFRRWRDFFFWHAGRGGSRRRARGGRRSRRVRGGGGATPSLCQRTPVFSYFVIRSAHLWDMAWFVRTFPRIEFSQNPRVPWQAWWNHLLAVWNSSEYAQRVDRCLELHRAFHATRAADGAAASDGAMSDAQCAFRTMRMTVHETAV